MNSHSKIKNPKRLMIVLTLAIPLIALVLLMMAAGSGQVVPPPQQAKIHEVPVQQIILQSSHQQQRIVYGNVEATSQSNLGFELSGKVTNILVDEGDILSKGTVLAELDTKRIDASMGELNATLERTQADLRLAQLSLKRVKELVSKNLESKQKLDEVTESTASAEALVNEIIAKKLSLQILLDKSVLYANEASTVLSQPIDKGTVVTAGQTIFTVQVANAFEVRIGMPQDQAFTLQVGQTHSLVYANTPLQGTVKSIAKQRKLNTRTIDVIFTLDVPNGLSLLPGDLVSFQYQQEVAESGAWVPKQALTSGIRGLWTLFVVAQVGEQKVSSKSVEILYSQQNKVFVRGAIKRNDWLIVNGGHRLVPEQIVRAVPSSNISGD